MTNTEFKSKVLTIAAYRPDEGKEEELKALLVKHQPLLRKYNLLTNKEGYLAYSSDESIVEVYEWVSIEAVQKAKQNDEIQKLWSSVHQISKSLALKELPEASKSAPGFNSFEIFAG